MDFSGDMDLVELKMHDLPGGFYNSYVFIIEI
jgi:hypothetical protein